MVAVVKNFSSMTDLFKNTINNNDIINRLNKNVINM